MPFEDGNELEPGEVTLSVPYRVYNLPLRTCRLDDDDSDRRSDP